MVPMFALAPIMLVVAVTVVVILTVRLLRRPDSPLLPPGMARQRVDDGILAPGDAASQAALRTFRLRNGWWATLVLVAFALAFALAARAGANPRSLAVLPGAITIVAVAAIAVWPHAGLRRANVTTAGARSADLRPRTVGGFGPAWGFALPSAGAGVLVAFLVYAGIVSGARADQTDNRAITVVFSDNSATAGPFPGWYYGVPLLVVTAVLVATVAITLRRIAGYPAPTSPGLRGADLAIRRTSTRLVMKLSSTGLFGYAGCVLVAAGIATWSAATLRWGVDDVWHTEVNRAAWWTGQVQMWTGAGFVLLAIALGASLLIDAWTTPQVSASAPVPTGGAVLR